jgi:hypothetical protein
MSTTPNSAREASEDYARESQWCEPNEVRIAFIAGWEAAKRSAQRLSEPTKAEIEAFFELYAADVRYEPSEHPRMIWLIGNALKAFVRSRSAQRSEVTEAMVEAAFEGYEKGARPGRPWFRPDAVCLRAALEAALAVANHAEQGNSEEL